MTNAQAAVHFASLPSGETAKIFLYNDDTEDGTIENLDTADELTIDSDIAEEAGGRPIVFFM